MAPPKNRRRRPFALLGALLSCGAGLVPSTTPPRLRVVPRRATLAGNGLDDALSAAAAEAIPSDVTIGAAAPFADSQEDESAAKPEAMPPATLGDADGYWHRFFAMQRLCSRTQPRNCAHHAPSHGGPSPSQLRQARRERGVLPRQGRGVPLDAEPRHPPAPRQAASRRRPAPRARRRRREDAAQGVRPDGTGRVRRRARAPRRHGSLALVPRGRRRWRALPRHRTRQGGQLLELGLRLRRRRRRFLLGGVRF
mmetsp:Transcript_26123/g.104514  ORF Transcript_26123/g.104514 Transcript_26123/m.104514 type:complete len:253 (-) Transcript_26123:291-1049(-)